MNSVSLIRADIENEFDRMARDFDFVHSLMEQNKEMEDFINESIIIASGNKYAINEMAIIHESAFTDKIKAFFEKIKNFFKKLFDKLGAAMNALFGEQKKFMEQYSNIIMNCKYNGGDVNDVKDHFKGLPRIIDAADNTDQAVIGSNMDKYFNQNITGNTEDVQSYLNLDTFENEANLNKALSNPPKKLDLNDEIKVQAFNEFVKTGYWSNKQGDGFVTKNDSNNNPDIDATFRIYFDGSEDTVTWSGDEVDKHFQVIINATYGGVSYMNKLEKLMTTITRKMDDAEKKMDDYVKAQQDKIQKAIKNEAPTDEKNTTGSGVSVTQAQIDSAAKNAKYDNEGNAKVNIGGKTYEFTGGKDGNSVPSGELETKLRANNVEVKKESYNFVNESPSFSTDASKSNADNTQATQKMTSGGSSSSDIKNVTDQNSKASNMNTNNQQVSNVSNLKDSKGNTLSNDMQSKANNLLDIDIHNRQGRVNADLQISSSIVRTMFNAFQLTNKDFFDIVKHHVQWYLSNPGAEKDTANKVTRKMDKNMNASGDQMKNPGNPPPPANP